MTARVRKTFHLKEATNVKRCPVCLLHDNLLNQLTIKWMGVGEYEFCDARTHEWKVTVKMLQNIGNQLLFGVSKHMHVKKKR